GPLPRRLPRIAHPHRRDRHHQDLAPVEAQRDPHPPRMAGHLPHRHHLRHQARHRPARRPRTARLLARRGPVRDRRPRCPRRQRLDRGCHQRAHRRPLAKPPAHAHRHQPHDPRDPHRPRRPDRLAHRRRHHRRPVHRSRPQEGQHQVTHDDYEPERSAPPQDLSAEMSVLGSMLLSRDAIADVTEIIKNPGDFYRPAHQTIFQAIRARYLDGAPVDPIVINDDLAKSGDLTRVGGIGYVHALVQHVPSAANGGYYAEIVRAKAVLRNLQSACTRTLHEIAHGTGETGELLDDLRAEVDGIVDDTNCGDQDTLIGADGEDFLEELENLQKHGPARGVKTGFTDFDSLTNGLQPGQLIVIAARPAIGKSTLGVDIVRHATIVEDLPAVFFSLEMSRTELKMKIASAQARIGMHHLQSQNGMTDDDWVRLAKVWPMINAAPLDIVDDPGLTLTKIRSRCRRIARKRELRLVVVDYLQLMEGELSGRSENRQQE